MKFLFKKNNKEVLLTSVEDMELVDVVRLLQGISEEDLISETEQYPKRYCEYEEDY